MLTAEMYHCKYGSLENLSSDNYDVWKPCIAAILSAKLAFEIVTGEETEKAMPIGNSAANVAKRESFKKRQGLAAAVILLSCTHEVGIHLSGITDPKEMWDTLAKILGGAASFGRRGTIGKAFDIARPKPRESILAYLARLNGLRAQLTGTEGAISDEKFLYHIYVTTPEQYQPTLDMMLGLPAGMATVASISQALRDAEQNRLARKADQDSESLGVARFAYGRRGNGRGNGRGGSGGKGRGGSGGKDGQAESNNRWCTTCNMNNHSTIGRQTSTQL